MPTAYSAVTIPLPYSENCHFLNIYTPKLHNKKNNYNNNNERANNGGFWQRRHRRRGRNKNGKLPVLFWIHGGGDNYGCSSQSVPIIYNGTNLIKNSNNYDDSTNDVIVVTTNYRLDILSHLYLNELTQENPNVWASSGNYGMLDIISALKWVKNNIHSFNGNPNKITIFGESSGNLFAFCMLFFFVKKTCFHRQNLYFFLVCMCAPFFVEMFVLICFFCLFFVSLFCLFFFCILLQTCFH